MVGVKQRETTIPKGQIRMCLLQTNTFKGKTCPQYSLEGRSYQFLPHFLWN